MSVRIAEDALGRLIVTLRPGEEVRDVLPVRAWPLSAPGESVSLVGPGGQELLLLASLDVLDAPSREAVERALARREFLPTITRVLAASDSEPSDWHVLTDRGEARFVLPSEDHLRALGEHGLLLSDEHGVRYRIPDVRALDPRSRKLLARHV